MSKKVSIIIPVYNGSNYLKEAIECALEQTYKNIEIIVVNDGSTDQGATDKIAKSYGNKIKYYVKENGGAASALNYGISKMTGDYMSWLSHDDLYYPEKIERQIQEIEKYDDKTILFSNFDIIDQHGVKYNSIHYDHKLLKKKPDYAVLRGCIGGITLLIPKKVLDDCGEFRIDLRCVQDYEMWFRMMLKNYKFVHMEDVLTMTRIHPLQDTQTSPKMITEGNWLWTYMTENYPKNRMKKLEGCEFLFYKEMENYLESSPYKDAVKNINKMAKKCLEEFKNNKQLLDITTVIIDNGNSEDLQKTLNCLKNQSFAPKTILIEGQIKQKNIKAIETRNEVLKEIKTAYFSFLHAGVTVKDNWIEDQLLLLAATGKGVIISDYPRPLRTGLVDNLCSLLVPIDGIIIKNVKNMKYENDYQLLFDVALEEGSFITGGICLENRKVEYDLAGAFDYVRRVIEAGKSSNIQMATLNYDIACIYNAGAKEGKKVYMYEPCAEYRELQYSRSFQLFKKYYDYKSKKKKTL